ncbi:MAG: hypothetical protein JWQ98_180 [Chlorobi bacterium]|nr:hypothetical protein [Chlorobiota bacterium]
MNRRNFFTLGAPRVGGDSAPRLMGDGGTQNTPPFLRVSSTGLEPYVPGSSDPWDYAKAAHLLRRIMVGPTDKEIRKAVADGFDTTVKNVFTTFTPPPTLIESFAGQDPQIRPGSADPTVIQDFSNANQQQRAQLHKWWLYTFANSPVSIQERMTLFWHNHFVSELNTVNFPEWMYGQNQLLRKNALGNFKQFVKDVTKDMAMLVYLDGIKNFKQGNKSSINENYGRELQELFTMGVVDWNGNPNYTQNDVSEAARALSGYSGTTSSKGTLYAGLQSQFIQARWDAGSKTFLGKTGAWKADDVVDIIFSERGDQVAKFICEKLYRAFVYDIPDRTVVAAMAETFKNGNWELKPVMDQLLRSRHFYDPTNIGALDRNPLDYIIGMVRGLGVTSVPDLQTGTTRNGNDARNRMDSLGMTLFDPPNVKGWPGGRTWVSTSTLPVRQKFSIDVAAGSLKQAGTGIYLLDPIAFAKNFPDPNDIHQLSDDMARFLLNVPPSASESAMLFAALLDSGVDYEWKIDDPQQKPAERIRKFLNAAFQLAKYQLY